MSLQVRLCKDAVITGRHQYLILVGSRYESYLSPSDSIVLALNQFFVLENDPTPDCGSQLPRATALILSSLGFIHDLHRGMQFHSDCLFKRSLFAYNRGRCLDSFVHPSIVMSSDR
ncbi:hypothetical protein BDR05DRAFT_742611 [Suillus weaverae]|nr:hypothetical protein BDR05DRAFT_742611 [Suillus weaverae]